MANLDSKAAQTLRRDIQNFYWGVWSELGVSGWGRSHEDWAIDPEPVIVFSPSVIASEPRLRDEAIDWCSDNWRHISTVRLRHLLNNNEKEQTEPWGQFAATVNQFSGAAKWPRATTERKFSRTGRSSRRPLSERSMIYLRMRSIFGLGARTEVLRYLLFMYEHATAAMLATQVNYTKRNVADACESLSQSGVLQSRQISNRLYFLLADRQALSEFIGPSADVHPDWPALLRVVNALFSWTDSATKSSSRVLAVETHRVFNEIKADLESLELGMPNHISGADFLPIWQGWSAELMKSLAVGKWPTAISGRPVRRAPGTSAAATRRVG